MTTNQNAIAEATKYLRDINEQRLFASMEPTQRSEFIGKIQTLQGNLKFPLSHKDWQRIGDKVLELVKEYPDLQKTILAKGPVDDNYRSITSEPSSNLDQIIEQLGNELITLSKNLEEFQDS